ncbi:MAG TPA: GTPase [Tepidisphaeraceae bacterium]|jgi:tRNA modification GTPase
MNPNRAILLTPAGTAAIAVVRIIGPAVQPFLAAHFSRPTRPGRTVHGLLADAGRTIDDPVVVLLSPTIADINLHGGQWVIRATLDLLVKEGFAVTHSIDAPLPADAVDADTILEQEVLTHLPLARTELGLRVLLAQPQAWQRFHEDSPQPPTNRTAENSAPEHTAEFDAARRRRIQAILDDHSLHHLLHPPRVAIVGQPNVGKSTLANQLFATERSITADLPGTTRDWVGEIANIDGLPVMLIDTPGQRPTTDPLESQAIHHSQTQIAAADLILLILDASANIQDQQEMLSAYPNALRILNKSDRGNPDFQTPPAWLRTIATTGHGIDTLRRAITGHFHCTDLDSAFPRVWTDRQRGLLSGM